MSTDRPPIGFGPHATRTQTWTLRARLTGQIGTLHHRQYRIRLQSRPSWREHAIDEHLAFAAHLRRTIDTVLGTSADAPGQTAQRIAEWVRNELRQTTDELVP
ncbi:MAG TPA: hypothetical protein DGG94_13910 [Micromonosporaceae bacterium]|nr:hypothetical protein [Micromonosporaceae bacterium]HCU50872.1 hypothetical protein [Micromonosporaceae bacterium]